ncbi:hypothetical protein [Candidatus Bathycorpusculum sp.]
MNSSADKSAACLFQMDGVVPRVGFEHGAVGYISNSSSFFDTKLE